MKKNFKVLTALSLTSALFLSSYPTAVAGHMLSPISYNDSNLVDIEPSFGWANNFRVNVSVMPGGSLVGNYVFPLQVGDTVQFSFSGPQTARVGVTNNGALSGARWASSLTGTVTIPSAGQWRFIIQNQSSDWLIGYGFYRVQSSQFFSAPIQLSSQLDSLSLGELTEQKLLEDTIDFSESQLLLAENSSFALSGISDSSEMSVIETSIGNGSPWQ